MWPCKDHSLITSQMKWAQVRLLREMDTWCRREELNERFGLIDTDCECMWEVSGAAYSEQRIGINEGKEPGMSAFLLWKPVTRVSRIQNVSIMWTSRPLNLFSLFSYIPSLHFSKGMYEKKRKKDPIILLHIGVYMIKAIKNTNQHRIIFNWPYSIILSASQQNNWNPYWYNFLNNMIPLIAWCCWIKRRWNEEVFGISRRVLRCIMSDDEVSGVKYDLQ